MTNFRVTINLSNFFHDHRHRARIFINDNVQTIGDLEERIENIFRIKNFYLTSQNEYLPSNEDIRILQKDENIWVIQKTHDQGNIPSSSPTLRVIDTNDDVKDRKKRSISATEDYLEQDLPKKKKKKKLAVDKNKEKKMKDKQDSGCLNSSNEKRKEKKIDDKPLCEYTSRDSQENCSEGYAEVEVQKVTPKRDKLKRNLNSDSKNKKTTELAEDNESAQNKGNVININSMLSVLQSHISTYNKKVKDKSYRLPTSLETSSTSISEQESLQKNMNNNNIKEPHLYKGVLSCYKKKVPVPTITDKYLEKKKVNIVKIEYISGGPSEVKHLKSTESNNSEIVKHNKDSNFLNIGSSNARNSENLNFNNIEQNSTIQEIPIKLSCKEEEIVMNGDSTFKNTDKLSTLQQNSREDKIDTNDMRDTNIFSNADAVQQNSPKSLNGIFNEMEVNGDLNAKMSCDKHSILNSTTKCRTTDHQLNDNSNIASANISLNNASAIVVDSTEKLQTNETVVIQNKLSKICHPSEKKKTCKPNFSFTRSDANLNLSLNQNVDIDIKQNFILKNTEDISQPSPNIFQTGMVNLEQKKSDIVTSLDPINVDSSIGNLKNDNVVTSNKIVSEINSLAAENDLIDVNLSSTKKKSNNMIVEEPISLSGTDKYSEAAENDYEMDVTKEVTNTLDGPSDVSILSPGYSSAIPKRKQLFGIGQLLTELRSNESIITGESMDSDNSEFVTKRQRKRIRKRRKKSNKVDNDSLNDCSIVDVSDYTPKPIRTIACPTLHLKFGEEEWGLLKVIDVNKKEIPSEKENKSHVDTSYVESITLECDSEDSDIKSFSINEEYILKSPSIKNLLPKIGDIIAFKILRITENYTPEISSYIVGKVVGFNANNNMVLYDILNGIEQCEEPTGRLAGQEVNEDNVTKSKEKEISWADVIDPRLLFP